MENELDGKLRSSFSLKPRRDGRTQRHTLVSKDHRSKHRSITQTWESLQRFLNDHRHHRQFWHSALCCWMYVLQGQSLSSCGSSPAQLNSLASSCRKQVRCGGPVCRAGYRCRAADPVDEQLPLPKCFRRVGMLFRLGKCAGSHTRSAAENRPQLPRFSSKNASLFVRDYFNLEWKLNNDTPECLTSLEYSVQDALIEFSETRRDHVSIANSSPFSRHVSVHDTPALLTKVLPSERGGHTGTGLSQNF